MTVKMYIESEITRPDTTPITSGLLDHFPPKVNDHFGMRRDEGLWPSYNYLTTAQTHYPCHEDGLDGEKAFYGADWTMGLPFAVQTGAQCSALGLDEADQKAEVGRVFDATASRSIETMLAEHRFVHPGASDPQWPDPVNVTATTCPPGLLNARVQLASLEGYMANNYAGLPVIHMPRAVATLLGANDIVWNGDKAYTRNGSRVVMGGGYDASESDGTWTMWATGEIYVEQSEDVFIQTVPTYSAQDASAFDDNTVITLAERMYRVAIDGNVVAQATVTVWS